MSRDHRDVSMPSVAADYNVLVNEGSGEAEGGDENEERTSYGGDESATSTRAVARRRADVGASGATAFSSIANLCNAILGACGRRIEGAERRRAAYMWSFARRSTPLSLSPRAPAGHRPSAHAIFFDIKSSDEKPRTPGRSERLSLSVFRRRNAGQARGCSRCLMASPKRAGRSRS